MTDEHLYNVTYDIADDRRWRNIFRLMNGYGEWLQLSVFQCRLTRARWAERQAALGTAMHMGEDHVLLIDVGQADSVTPRVQSLGKRRFEPVERAAVVI